MHLQPLVDEVLYDERADDAGRRGRVLDACGLGAAEARRPVCIQVIGNEVRHDHLGRVEHPKVWVAPAVLRLRGDAPDDGLHAVDRLQRGDPVVERRDQLGVLGLIR